MTTMIGYVEPDSPGEKAGLKAGDKILEVDGKPVTRFSGMNDSVIWNVIRSEGDTIPFVVERNGQRLSFSVVPYMAATQRLAAQERAAGPDLSRVQADDRSGGSGLARGGGGSAAGRCHPRIQRPADVQRDRARRISSGSIRTRN